VGRVWRRAGACVVAVRGRSVIDITARLPDLSHLRETEERWDRGGGAGRELGAWDWGQASLARVGAATGRAAASARLRSQAVKAWRDLAAR
jgi:fumarylacetoacetate (FAA) hydrolase family protein